MKLQITSLTPPSPEDWVKSPTGDISLVPGRQGEVRFQLVGAPSALEWDVLMRTFYGGGMLEIEMEETI